MRLRAPVISVAILLLVGTGWSAPTSWAATGDISTSPPHLALGRTELGSTTVSWSSSNAATAQVWVSVNGGPEKLFATEPSGSQRADWIKSSYTVFSLYEGTSHRTLLDYTSVTAQPRPRSSFGFDYWPFQSTSSSTLGTSWSWKRSMVETDLDQIASMGGTLVRFMIWPTGEPSVWHLKQDHGGWLYKAELEVETTNIVELMRLCHERGLKAIVAFANPFITDREPESGQFWWQWAYGSDWEGFRSDALKWVNHYVKAIESSPYRSTVVAYDYQNELSNGSSRAWEYLRYLYDNSSIPRGKRAASILFLPDDLYSLEDALDGRHLDYSDFHSYPEQNLNANIEQAYDLIASELPDTTVILGEFGQATPNASLEPAQSQTVMNVIARAKAKPIPYFIHWMLWDNTPPSPDQTFGLAYRRARPKNALGSALALTGSVLNPDFEYEDPQDLKPAGWSGGGTAPVTLRTQTSALDSPTNNRFARLKTTGASAAVWMSSQRFAVHGGQRLFANAYIRANMTSVRLVVTEYDEDAVDPSRPVHRTEGPVLRPNAWEWSNYLQDAGSWKAKLDWRTDTVKVWVWARARQGSPSYLDVDAVSAASRWPG